MITQTTEVLLEINDLHAGIEGQKILNGVNLKVNAGEIHAIMGRNGSGKSTLSKVIAGHPLYSITSGEIIFKGQSLEKLDPEEIASMGIFLGFQYPVEIPGVSNSEFLRAATNSRRKYLGKEELDSFDFDEIVKESINLIQMKDSFLERNVNEGFSGGEKKRNEILQMSLLEPLISILDETDSGLDIDSLRIVSQAINALSKKDTATILITHYQRLLNEIEPTFVHIMDAGKIVKTGNKNLAIELEKGGYDLLKKKDI
ncbi:Fe-S cluster assembly ATPase SufC [Prochlorococcus marinus]|uniref:ABC transporter, ATP binding component n=1 Tax=Prochlorococcus marinus (strain MIT 9211) TaxID=93059 RepID=A9B9D4_PROM4|nr:Fe-S cluster assembly ATPase SufC [Prochlorococcus marinus]ABX08011.1 ABC transporter, ATP binding component [Prochlorococcus marinus str. MIT 9211]